MKSAYELAMERLDKEQGGAVALTESQKAEIAEIRNVRDAKLAERRIMFDQKKAEAMMARDGAALEALQQAFSRDNQRLNEDAEEEVERIRKAAARSE